MVGIDPVAATMAEASRRAAGPVRKGGLPNARFVVAAAESLPCGLEGLADLVTVTLPWGSLLRGALALDPAAARGIASLVAPAGRVEMLVAPAARDGLAAEVDVEARLAGALDDDWCALGLELVDARPATGAEIAATRSTWARRLALARGSRRTASRGARAAAPLGDGHGAGSRARAADARIHAVILGAWPVDRARTAASRPRGSSSLTTTRTCSSSWRSSSGATATRSRPHATARRRSAGWARPGPTS